MYKTCFTLLKAFGTLCLASSLLINVAHASPLSVGLASRQSAQEGSFRNPLNAQADPTLVYFEGNYYLSTTQGDRITVWKSPSLATLVTVEPVDVFQDTDPTRNVELWAPAFHQFDTGEGPRWYIYYTAADSSVPDSQRDSTHRLYVLESAGNDPAGPYEFKAQIADTGIYAIDGEPFVHNGQAYFAWSSPGRGFDGGPQQLYVAKMTNPWTVEGDPVALPNAGGCDEVREGPTPLYRDGKTFLTYSACDTGKPDYQIWSIVLEEDANPLSSSDWQQVPGPLFSRNDEAGVWGPGHHFFFKSPDDTEDWIAYHGKNTREYTYDFRTTRAQRISWNSEGMPDLGEPLAVGATQQLPAGDPGRGSLVIDDTDTGALGMRVEYDGEWTIGSQCGVTCFNGDDHYSNEAGATATYHFTGTHIAVYSSLGPDHGNATFTLDGGEASTPVSYYDRLRVGEHLVYLSPELELGDHTLTITVTGEKETDATDAYITIVRAEVYSAD